MINMDNVQKRQNKLIEIMTSTSSYMTVRELASLLEVSERTIHNDLDSLSNTYQVVRKRGVGIKIFKTSEKNSTQRFSLFDRRLDIAKKLIIEGQRITYIHLSNEYYVAQSSIYADIAWIKDEILGEYHDLIASDSSGTYLKADENTTQKIILKVNQWLITSKSLGFFSEHLIEYFSLLYGSNISEVCWQLVKSFQNNQSVPEADYYLLNVYSILTSLVYRMQHGHHLAEHMIHEFNSSKVMKMTNYPIVVNLFESLNSQLDERFEYTNNDMTYLAVNLKANKISFIQTKPIIDEYSRQFTNSLLNKMAEVLGFELNGNSELRYMVESHVSAMFERIQNGISIQNPMLEIIKQEYHAMFELVWIVVDYIDPEVSKSISEDEIGFLLLYFQNELEKQKKSKRVLVVCPNGIVASDLISRKIREILPPLDIIEVTSLEEVEINDLEGFSFIISTIPIMNVSIPVVQVSMILTPSDIELIKDQYEALSVDSTNGNRSIVLKTSHLDKNFIFYSNEYRTKQEVLESVIHHLYQANVVKEGYLEAVEQREQISSTAIITGGAIPHASTKLVNKTVFALYVTNKPIEWGNYKVKVVIFFVLADSEMKSSRSILQEAFNFIKTQEVVEMLSNVKSKSELLRLINIGGIDDR